MNEITLSNRITVLKPTVWLELTKMFLQIRRIEEKMRAIQNLLLSSLTHFITTHERFGQSPMSDLTNQSFPE
jgi:hypothetical protein